MTRRGGLLAASLLSAMSLAASPDIASAQEAQTRDSDETLSTIVVTARRVTEDVQDVPITVNVLSAGDLENRGAVNFANISNLVPNLVWDDAGGGSVNANLRMTIRGISSQASQNGFDPGIGIYVDDVYIGNAIGFNRSLLDVDRVEVLKGPQGTLFGRNSTAGAISVHSRRPDLEDAYLDFDVNLGNYDLHQERVVGNLPLGENAAVKVSLINRDRDGYQYNLVTDRRDANAEDYHGGRAQLLVEATPNLDLLFSAEYFQDQGANEVFSCWGVNPNSGFDCTIHPTREDATDDQLYDNGTRTEREMWGASLRASWDMANAWELTSITAYRSLTALSDKDADFSANDNIREGYAVPEDTQFSQEVRVATDQERRLRGVMGVYYFHEDRSAVLPLTISETIAEFFANNILGDPGLAAQIDRDLTSITFSQQTTESFAVFGQGQYDLTDQWTVELGLRQTWDSKDFVFDQTIDPLWEGIGIVLPASSRSASDSNEWQKLTGNLSLLWQPTEDTLIYGRFARGYKSGGYNSSQFFGSNPSELPFGPEVLDQYELGVKWEGFDRRLRINVAGFLSYYDDIQTQINDVVNGSQVRRVINAGGAESKGVEFEVSALLFEGFTVDANLGLQHAEFTEFPASTTGDLTGNEIFYAPNTTASITGTYVTDISTDWEFLASATASYRSEMWLDQTNVVSSPSLTTISGRIGVQNASGWGVHLWGVNLGDERVITAYGGPEAGGGVRVNSPRTFGVEFSGRF